MVSKNPHHSPTLWDIWIKFCIHIYFNIVRPLVCKTVTRGLPCIILAGQGILAKMLITLELHGIFLIKFCILIHFNCIETQVYQMVIRLCQSIVAVLHTCVSKMYKMMSWSLTTHQPFWVISVIKVR